MSKIITSKHAARLTRNAVREAVQFQALDHAYSQLSDVSKLLTMCKYKVDGSFLGSSDPDLKDPYMALEARLTDLVGEVDTVSKMLEAELWAYEDDEVVL